MNPNLEKYITYHYYELLNIAKKYTKNDYWASELLHDVILQFYDQKEYKGKVDDNSIKYYIIRALMINWCYPTSPFYRREKSRDKQLVDIEEAFDIVTEETNMDEHLLLDIVEKEWSHTNWFNKIIFEKYMVLGSLKKVSADTSIPLTSIHKYVNDTRKTIKQNAFKKLNNLD